MPVEVTGLAGALKYLQGFQAKVTTGSEDGLSKAVQAVAAIWADNYAAEGGNHHQWDALAELTRSIRQFQGYDPEHPILVRTGDLRQAAIDFFLRAQPNSTHQVPGATAQLSMSTGEATLVLTGVKVENQWGNPAERLPAREFWFVDENVRRAAAEAFAQWLEDTLK